MMDTIYAVYEHLKGAIESSATIRSHLGAPVTLMIYGSAVNGLFDVASTTEMQSDLDLTLIIDEVASRKVNKYKTESEILELIKFKLQDIKKKQGSLSMCKITNI